MESIKKQGMVFYRLSDGFIKDEFVKTGQEPKRQQVYKFDFENLTSDVRKITIELCSMSYNYNDRIRFSEDLIEDEYTNFEGAKVERFKVNVPAFDYEINDENFHEAIKVIDKFYREVFPEYEEYKKEKRKQRNLIEKKRDEERNAAIELRLKIEKEREIEKEKFDKEFNREMVKWIKEKGSERLVKGINENYNMRGAYVTERARLEFPEYYVDFKEIYEWDEKINPSLEALKELELIKNSQYFNDSMDVEIVWFTSGRDNTTDDYNEGYFEQTEGIVIRKFLGKYYLVKEM